MVRLVLCEYLAEDGFITFEAGKSSEGITMLEAHPEITVVFTDIQMPGKMDGLALAHYVRDRYPPTAIVISSGNIRPSLDELPKATYFIAKPYNYAVLKPIFAKVREDLARVGTLPQSETGAD